MSVLIICEKPSVAKTVALALGAVLFALAWRKVQDEEV